MWELVGFQEWAVPNEEAKIKMLTVEEANALLSQVHLILRSLREVRGLVLRTQAQIEIEEMTGTDSSGQITSAGQATITKLMETFHYQTRQFEEKLESLLQMGAHLKDLDLGVVDFYSRRGGEIVFLCWKEGEAEIRHWHTLQGNFKNRQSLY
jgi:hypothetical protein